MALTQQQVDDYTSAEQAAYANSDFDGSPSKAALFVAAVRRLIILRPAMSQRDQSELVRYDLEVLRKLLPDAEKLAARANSNYGGIRYFSTRCRA